MVAKLQPVISEKSAFLAKSGTYMFNVSTRLSKIEIAKQVEDQYDTEVSSVKVLVRKGKIRNSYQKGNRPIPGRQSARKIAYVKVTASSKISAFDELIEGLDEEEA